MDSGRRAHIYQMVCGQHRLFIMLYHEYGITQVAQFFQSFEQTLIVALVKADGRFVQNIQNAHQGRTDLGRQADALTFSAGQGA